MTVDVDVLYFAIGGFVAASLAMFLLGRWRGKRSARSALRQVVDVDEARHRQSRDEKAFDEASPVARLHADGRGAVFYVNDRWQALTGQDWQESMGDGWLDAVHSGDRARIEELWSEAIADNREVTTGYRVSRADGYEPAVLMRAAPVLTSAAGLVGFAIAVDDVTVLVKPRQMPTGEEVVAIDGMDGEEQFLELVSHELRVPLTSLIGFTEILRATDEGLSAGDRAELIELLSRKATQLASKVDDLLVQLRAEHGTLNLVSVPVDLKAQAAQILESLDLVDRIKADSDDTPARVIGDPARVRQILRNLIDNATTHGKDPITVRINGGAKVVQLQVIDSGHGIPAHQLDQIFDPSPPSDTGNESPRPVGLAVCRTLAHLMGGELTYEQTTDGSTFQLSLPRYRS